MAQGKQVLLIEKDRIQQKVLANLLSFGGHNAVVLNGDQESLARTLQHEHIDIVLVDWKLLERNDMELLTQMRELGVGEKYGLLTMLPEVDRGEAEQAANAGVLHHIPKPFGGETLDEKIRAAAESESDAADTEDKAQAAETAAGSNAPSAASETPASAEEQAAPKLSPKDTHTPKSMEEFLKSGVRPKSKYTPEQEARLRFRRGKKALEARKYNKAGAEFAAALKNKPLFPDAHKGLAMAYQGVRDISKFRHHLMKTVETYLRLGMMERAKNFFPIVKRHHPDAPNIFKTYAQSLRRKGNTQHAADALLVAEEFFPNDIDVPIALAELYQEAGQNEEALQNVTKALESGGGERAGELYMTLTGKQWSTVLGPEGAQEEAPEAAPSAPPQQGDEDDYITVEADDVTQAVADALAGFAAKDTKAEAPPPEEEVVEIATLEDSYVSPQQAPENPTLLIVDDEPHIRMLLEEALEELEDDDVNIIMAENGLEGLETIKRERPNLVFLDVMMPKMNGFEVCETVKKKLVMDDVFIVMLTAKGQEFDKVKGREAGADIYMTKPFSPMEVLTLARKILGLV